MDQVLGIAIGKSYQELWFLAIEIKGLIQT
jgi:hypothetical protein